MQVEILTELVTVTLRALLTRVVARRPCCNQQWYIVAELFYFVVDYCKSIDRFFFEIVLSLNVHQTGHENNQSTLLRVYNPMVEQAIENHAGQLQTTNERH